MPSSIGLLKRERFIQLAGLIMLISPALNILASFFLDATPLQARLTPRFLLAVITSHSPVLWVLWGANIIMGLFMLKGRRSSWLPVLALLFLFIAFNLFTFKNDLQYGWLQPTLDLTVNLALFVLIYTQEFYQSSKSAALAALRTLRPSHATGPIVEFSGQNQWSKIVAMTTNHVSMRAMASPPKDIQNRPVVLQLTPNIVLHARFVQTMHTGNHTDYLFEFIDIDETTRDDLKHWLKYKKIPGGKKAA